MDDRDIDARERDDVSPAGDDVETTVTADPGEDIEVRAPERLAQDAEIRRLGKRFRCMDFSEDCVAVDMSVDEFKKQMKERLLAQKPTPIPTVRTARVTGAAPRYKALRAFKSEDLAYRSGMWCLGTIYGDRRAQQWCAEHGIRAQAEGVLTKGGALVPDEMSQAIIDLREERGVARRLARVWPMNSDTLSIPRRTGGITAYWVGENTAPTTSNNTWDQVTLVAKKLGALVQIPNELVEDAVIDIAEHIAGEIAYAFADKEDEAFINGDGTSTYGGIYGLRPKIIDGNHAAGAVDGASNIDTFAEVTQADLDNVLGVLPAYALAGATWLCSSPAKALVFDSLAAAAGGNTIMTMAGRPAMAYLGYPVVVSQVMPTSTGDLSNVAMLAVGDFMKAVALGDRRGFRVQVLTERYAELDQIGLVGFERVDIVWHDLGDGTNAGPVACLIGE